MFSFTGDTVLDPFAGTGTTTVAALTCDRNSIANELDPRYYAMAQKRIRKELEQGRVFAEPPSLVLRRA